jgi:hypothetical protein
MIPTLPLLAGMAAAVVGGLREDGKAGGGSYSLLVDNSHFVLETPGINRVVAHGPQALSPLVREMRRPDVTLDTFARCYTACDQILEKAGLKEPVHWYGGSIDTEGKFPRVVKIPRIDGFSAEFRRKQVAEIIRRAKEVGLRLDAGR